MFFNHKKDSLFNTLPTILLHRSHQSQIAIGGAMLTELHNTDKDVDSGAAKPASGGWRTRFDGGHLQRFTGYRLEDEAHTCTLVAMHVEGLIHISGADYGEGFECVEERVEVGTSCYAVVVIRTGRVRDYRGKTIHEGETRYVYMCARFSFSDRIQHDGLYDLNEAYELACTERGLSRKNRFDRRWEPDFNRAMCPRDWFLVSKKDVPGRVRQVLHRTIDTVRQTVENQFGQGADFFRTRPNR